MEPTKETTLTAKQKRFAQEFCIDLNRTQAAIRAGYSMSTAYSIGSRLLRNVEIQKYISEIQNDLEKASGITKLKVLNGFSEIAFSNISRLHNSWIQRKDFDLIPDIDKAAIQEISTKTIKRNDGTNNDPVLVDVEYVRVKLYDRLTALTKISDLLGFFEPTKFDISSKIDRLSDDDVDRLADQIFSQAIANGKHL